MQQPVPFELSLRKLALSVHLGVSDEERAERQRVYLDFWLRYPAPPQGWGMDGAGYDCYDTLSRKAKEVAESEPVALVEHLLHRIYRTLRAEVAPEVAIRLRLTKPLPPSLVGYEVEGASVEYTDEIKGLA